MLISQITESTTQQLITISVESRHTINMYNNTSYMFTYLCNYKAGIHTKLQIPYLLWSLFPA